MITEDYVSFEIAKLLKEKGFNGLCNAYYDCFTTDNFHSGCEPTDFNSINTRIRNIVSAPTLQMAMKWLRKKHNLYIVIEPTDCFSYYWIIYFMNKSRTLRCDDGEYFITTEQTCNDVIKYCLENLV